MPEYVYALRGFLPEHKDEVSFHAGERIEVIEKDDMYGDGWWHGRTLAGGVGLFPVSYTAPALTDISHVLPSPEPVSESPGLPTSNSKFVLQPLTEESESEASGINILSPVPKHPTTLLNSDPDTELPHEGEDSRNLASGKSEMMKATMTVVQKVIEQLGHHYAGEDGDSVRYFSFASTRDEANTENSDTNSDLSDFGGTGINGNDDDGENWHKGARRKLAAKAKRAVEEAEKLEAIMGDNENGRKANGTQYSTIDTLSTADAFVPPKDETDIPTATKPSFLAPQTPVPTGSLPGELGETPPTSEKDIYSGPISPPTTLPNIQRILKRRSSTPACEISNGLFYPASVGHIGLKRKSMTSFSSAPGILVNDLQVQQQQPNSTSVFTWPASITVSPTAHGVNETPPMMEWSVKEVVDWLKSKGFDQDVCNKFIEQEITGDVLLELDVNLLKSEIGIMAFGKRMRITNAITNLRRSPSIEYSDHRLSPTQLYHSNSLTRSRSRTQSQSPGTTLATTVGHHVHYSQSSFGSSGAGYGGQQSGHLEDNPVNINGDMKSVAPVGMGSGTAVDVAAGMSAGVGLGIVSLKKGPPSRLLLSPALKESAARTVSATTVNGEDEERGHKSDGEIVLNSTSMHRRIFGMLHESAISIMSSSSRSKGLPLSSLIVLDKVNNSVKGNDTGDKDSPFLGIRRARSSLDAKPADRVSVFGATFGGPLGKSRKPPPSEDTLTEKVSRFSLPKLHSLHRSLSTGSHRPSNSSGSPQKSPNDFTRIYDEKGGKKSFTTFPEQISSNLNSNVTTGDNANAPETVNGASGSTKRGVNIMDEIGEPDHTGWMRKRGDMYHSWKRRYFILKGPHLYFLRSNHRSGYIHVAGYTVTADENVDPGRYGFRIDHDRDKSYYFSSEERNVISGWMKAIMKATISRDYAKPVETSCNIPTIPLVVAQAMNPVPRPPSPSACEAAQRALRRENTKQLSAQDTLILGLNVTDVKDERARLDSIFSRAAIVKGESSPSSPTPPRPSRRLGRMGSGRTVMKQADDSLINLIKWANTHLPKSLRITDSTGFLYTGLALLRLAESIKGQPSSPPVPDSAFPAHIHDDKLDGLFMLFDFLLDGDVKIGSVSINDVRLGKRDKIIQILKALKTWEAKLKALDLSITLRTTSPAAFMLM